MATTDHTGPGGEPPGSDERPRGPVGWQRGVRRYGPVAAMVALVDPDGLVGVFTRRDMAVYFEENRDWRRGAGWFVAGWRQPSDGPRRRWRGVDSSDDVSSLNRDEPDDRGNDRPGCQTEDGGHRAHLALHTCGLGLDAGQRGRQG